MTETPDLIARLRTCAAGLCVADHDEFTAAETAAPDLLGAAADHIDMLLKSMESLRDAHLAEHEAAGRAEDARRRFLEAAVCHPGPPMSETEDYDPDADLSDLEGSVLERMDMETRWHRELMEIRREAEGILARTPDPSRSTVQVFKDLLAHFIAFHQHLEERVTAANEQVASTKRAALDTLDERQVAADARLAREVNTVAMLRRRCERYEGWWALPVAQRHPLGPEFSDGVGSSRPDLAEIEQIVNNALAKRYPNGGHHEETMPLVERVRREIGRGLATLGGLNAERDAVAEHIRRAGGDPAAATVAQIADAMNATSEGVTFTPNAAGDGVTYEIDQKARVVTIAVVGGDRVADLGLAPPQATVSLADRIIDSAYRIVPPYTDKCTSMGTSYEEAGEDWARSLASEFSCDFVTARQVVALVGAERARDVLTEAYATNVHPVTVANRVAEQGLALAQARVAPPALKSPVEVRSRCPETGETRFARCPWTAEGAVDTVELPPGGSQTDLCETAIALYQQRSQTDQTPFVITGFIPALSPDPDLCWMRGPPKVMQRIIANPDEPEDVRRWTWVGVGGVTFTRAKP